MTEKQDKCRAEFSAWWKQRDLPYATGSEEAIAREAWQACAEARQEAVGVDRLLLESAHAIITERLLDPNRHIYFEEFKAIQNALTSALRTTPADSSTAPNAAACEASTQPPDDPAACVLKKQVTVAEVYDG